MQPLQSLAALVRSPDAAVIVAQAVQAGDLATRQGQASMQREMDRRGTQVQAQSESQSSASIGARDPASENSKSRRRLSKGGSLLKDEAKSAPFPPHRLDILA